MSPQDRHDGPVRDVGRWGALSTVAGSMVGIGIFLVPPLVAEKLPTVVGFSSVWLFAALTALAGAVSYAELGARFPHAGGDYLFQHEAYGGAVAFASGWLLFGGIFTGSVAALAVPLCEHQLTKLLGAAGIAFSPDATIPLVGMTRAQAAAILVVVVLTAVNSFRVRISSVVQTVTTLVPVAALTVGGLWILTGTPEAAATAGAAPTQSTGWGYLGDWIQTYGRVYFVFSGWNAVIYIAGEVRDPGDTLPVGLIGGTLLVTAVYAILCAAFLTALGFSGLAGATEAGSAAATAVGGSTAGTVVAGIVGVGILASLNATILGGARVCYAMAERGAIAEYFDTLNEFGVPMRALWVQAAGAALYIVTGTFGQILDFVAMAMMLVGILTVATIWVFRRRDSGPGRPWESPLEDWFPSGWLHPGLPLFYITASAALIVAQLVRAVGSDAASAWYPVWGVVGFLVALGIGALRGDPSAG